MKPVHQTIFGDKVGNCFAACIASLLEMPCDEVPNFCAAPEDVDWTGALNEWLAERGLAQVDIKLDPDIAAFWPFSPTVYCIIAGPSPRGNFSHCVVGRFNPGVNALEITHDPHPSGDGLVGHPTSVMFLLALRPELVAASAERRAA